MPAFRQIPEGMCKRCAGTGNGEEMADLGEAPWHGAELPIRKCTSCAGSGLAIAKTEITALGLTLLLAIPVAIWASPPRVRLILILASASIAICQAVFWRLQTREKTAAPLPDLRGPATEGMLSLNAAIESHRQTAEQPESHMMK